MTERKYRPITAKGRLRQPKGMNKTESDYALELEVKKLAGLIVWYRFEGIKLRIGESCFYTPDFFVMHVDGTLECHEVKGHWEDDARVKMRAVAEMYPFRFLAIKRDGKGWKQEEF